MSEPDAGAPSAKAGDTSADSSGMPSLPPIDGGAGPPAAGEDASSASPNPRAKKRAKHVKETVIDHTYRDFSQVQVESDEPKLGMKEGKNQANFPAKLHAIVSDPNNQHIICWQVRIFSLHLWVDFLT